MLRQGVIPSLSKELNVSVSQVYKWIEWNLEELQRRGAVKVLRRRKVKRYVIDKEKFLQVMKELGYLPN